MSTMKTNLTTIPMCPREHFALYKSLSRLILCYKKDWDTLLHLVYFGYLSPVKNYLITKLYVTDNFSACREYLIRLRRIYNFWLFHANIIQLSYTFGNFLYYFGTNLLIQCPVPVPVCCMFYVLHKTNIKRSPNGIKTDRELFWNI